MEQLTQKWYFRKTILIVALLTVGPLALPLLWFNPYYSKRLKIIFSIAVLIISYYLWTALMHSLNVLKNEYQLIFQNI